MSVATYVMPVVAGVLGVLVLGETITPPMLAGSALVLVGVVIFTQRWPSISRPGITIAELARTLDAPKSDGHDQRGRVIRACRACGRHATSESRSLEAGHRFARDSILLAVRYDLQLGAATEASASRSCKVSTACTKS
jgi:hypothetical protein